MLLVLLLVALTALAARWVGSRSHEMGGAAPRTSQTPSVPTLTSARAATPSPSPRASPALPSPTALLIDPHNVYAADARGAFSPVVRGIPERVYVPNTLDGTISVIDPATFRVVKTLRVGGQPHHVTPSWDLRRLYVDNPGSGLLNVIDPRTARLVGDIRVASPYNLYFTPDGSKALVIAEYDQEIEFRDPRTWRLVKRVPIPGSGVDHLDFSANGRYLLVSDEYTGLLVRVSTVKMRVTGMVRVGGRPVDVKVSPDGRAFFVANQGLSGVTVISPHPLRQSAFIRTGVGAHGFAVSRDGRYLYVSNRIEGTVSVISFATRRVVATWNVGGSPDMLQVSPSGAQLWTSNRFSDTVSVISTRTGRVTHTIRVGGGPHGLCFFPSPGRYSIGHNGVYR